MKNFGSLILNAFLGVVGGDDLKSDLNHNALLGLDALLRNDVVAEADVQRVMAEISSKVRDIIDSRFYQYDYVGRPGAWRVKTR